MTKATVMAALLYGALPSVAMAQGQNPSPMVETTRAHERLTRVAPAGVLHTVQGPGERMVDVFVPAATVVSEPVTLVVHFHGAAWIAHQAVAALESNAVERGGQSGGRLIRLRSVLFRSDGVRRAPASHRT